MGGEPVERLASPRLRNVLKRQPKACNWCDA